MTTPLIHGEMLRALRNFFPSTVTIQQNTPTQGSDGALTPGWANLTGHVAIPCRIAPLGLGAPAAQEARRSDMTVTTAQLWIVLRGTYPSITPAMQAVASDGLTYNILSAEQDGSRSITRLGVEKVSV